MDAICRDNAVERFLVLGSDGFLKVQDLEGHIVDAFEPFLRSCHERGREVRKDVLERDTVTPEMVNNVAGCAASSGANLKDAEFSTSMGISEGLLQNIAKKNSGGAEKWPELVHRFQRLLCFPVTKNYL